MCGLVGLLTTGGQSIEGLEQVISRMGGAIEHRGPDSSGYWGHEQGEWLLGMGHRRLAIVDLSPAGHQPMLSVTGRFALAFNGEIYNHKVLRDQLQRNGLVPNWRGHSDTETLLAGFEAWGVSETLKRAVGMFAIALWDMATRRLILARDRFGEKPLYYGWVEGSSMGKQTFGFASELKAFRAIAGFSNNTNPAAVHEYFRTLYIPAPLSIYEGLYKLEPGTILTVDPASLTRFSSPPQTDDRRSGIVLERYWSYAEVVKNGQTNTYSCDQMALNDLEFVLERAVVEQSLADVPLGAFLSGGVDSSLIAAMMQKNSSRRVDTFTIGFDVPGYDESQYARAVAGHLGTQHHELRLSPFDAIELVQQMPEMYCEPFADSSQIPTHLVCQSARRKVTVALSGDAGDEVFGGYNRYLWAPRVWNKTSWMGKIGRNGLCNLIELGSPHFWDSLVQTLRLNSSTQRGVVRVGEKLHKLSSRLRNTSTLDDLYLALCSEWRDSSEILVKPKGPDSNTGPENMAGLSDLERMMFLDALTYLPGDILCKVDRASMGVSLETRAPFLDHRVAEAAWRLPAHLKIESGIGKQALRKILYKYVPKELIERPKAGFALPIGNWLREELRQWAIDLLSHQKLQNQGWLNVNEVNKLWKQHQNKTHDHSAKLWALLMWQAWQESI